MKIFKSLWIFSYKGSKRKFLSRIGSPQAAEAAFYEVVNRQDG
jgi:hypothetical protein